MPDSANDSNWVLAIDFGTSYTVAASRIEGRSPEVIEIDGERRVPSIVLIDDDGGIMVGRSAENLASSHPGRVLRAPKSRLGEPAPVVLGGKAYQTVDLVAALLEYVYDNSVRYHGSDPSEVRLTHPATWSGPRRQQLVEAATGAGIADAVLVPEPVAAAIAYADDGAIEQGQHVLVYDLGGGTFDTAALQAAPNGFVVMGRPGGDPRLGGELFDELLANAIGDTLDPATYEQIQVADDPLWTQAATGLRREARRVKEALSTHPYADLVLGLPQGLIQQRIDREQLDRVIRPYISESVDVLQQTASGAGLTSADLASIYLVGGASRTPLVEELVTEAYPAVPISRRGDPKGVVAVGATHPLATPTTLAQRSSLDRAFPLETPAAAPSPAPAPSPTPAPAHPVAPAAAPADDATVADTGTVVDNGTVVDVPGQGTVVDGGTLIDAAPDGSAAAFDASDALPPPAQSRSEPRAGLGSASGDDGHPAPSNRTKIGLGVGVAALLGLGALGISTLGSEATDDADATTTVVSAVGGNTGGGLTVDSSTLTTQPDADTSTTDPVVEVATTLPTTTSTTPPTTAPPTTAPPLPTTVPPRAVPSQAEVDAAMFRASDLDTVGWVDLPDDDPSLDTSNDDFICGPEPTYGVVSTTTTGVQNANDSFRTMLHSIQVHESVETAQQTFQDSFDVYATCDVTTYDVNGVAYDIILQAAPMDTTEIDLPCADDTAFVVALLSNEDALLPNLAQVTASIRCGSNISTVGFVVAGGIEDVVDIDFAQASTLSTFRLNNLPGSR